MQHSLIHSHLSKHPFSFTFSQIRGCRPGTFIYFLFNDIDKLSRHIDYDLFNNKAVGLVSKSFVQTQ